MANQEHLDILKQGVDIWNKWRKEHPELQPDLREANLKEARLNRADLRMARMQGANLYRAQMQEANLFRAHLEEAHLNEVNLAGADLRSAFFDSASTLRYALPTDTAHHFISVADVRWGDVNLALLKWPQKNWAKVLILGDERKARHHQTSEGKVKDKTTRLARYEEAVRANRQLATVLRGQGLNELADHFSYRAQLLQRVVWRRQRRILKYILSWFLYLIAGYGYRPLRSLVIYLLLIAGFATGYYAVTHVLHAQPYPLAWYEALILSVSSFHGRGFFQPVQSLGDPVAILASIEAVFGLLIEISFIATFTQRFFGK